MESDILIINFGLHYLVHERKPLVADITKLFTMLKDFATLPGKVLIWRETSAQLFNSEGGEYPGNRFGE